MANTCRIWARVVHGLEWVAAAEAALLPGASRIVTGHRDLLFDCPVPAVAGQLSTVDDAYILWGEVAAAGHTRPDLARLAESCRALPLPPLELPAGAGQLRVTASFLGRRTYSRFEIEDEVGPVLAARLGLDYTRAKSAAGTGVVWARLHLAGETARLGLRLAAEPLHRRPWRSGTQPGALHPPVAATMALLADLAPGQTVLDPCCGSGTLLIEAGLRCAGLILQGGDIAPAAVEQARVNAAQAGVALELAVGDAATVALPAADRILANPPWDRAVAAAGGLTADNLPAIILAGLQPQGRAVLLADQALALPARLAARGTNPLLTQTLRVSGRLAELIVVGKGPCFADNELGRALAAAWDAAKIDGFHVLS